MNQEQKKETINLYYREGDSVCRAIRKFCLINNVKRKDQQPNESSARDVVKKFENNGSVGRIEGSGRKAVGYEDIRFQELMLVSHPMDDSLNSFKIKFLIKSIIF